MGNLTGKHMAIITDAFEEPLKNTNCIELQFAVAAGPEKGERFHRKYYYKDTIPPGVTADFAKMGAMLAKPEQLRRVLPALVGSLVKVFIFLGDDAKQHIAIHGYVGRDNPSKYIATME